MRSPASPLRYEKVDAQLLESRRCTDRRVKLSANPTGDQSGNRWGWLDDFRRIGAPEIARHCRRLGRDIGRSALALHSTFSPCTRNCRKNHGHRKSPGIQRAGTLLARPHSHIFSCTSDDRFNVKSEVWSTHTDRMDYPEQPSPTRAIRFSTNESAKRASPQRCCA